MRSDEAVRRRAADEEREHEQLEVAPPHELARVSRSALRNGFATRGAGGAGSVAPYGMTPISAGEWRRKTIASGITSVVAVTTTTPAVQRQP